MHNAAFADHMERWGRLTGGVAEHASDAAFLQPHQESLIQARKDAWEAKQRQLRHRAAAQQATRDLEAAMARAQDAATRLQCGLLGKYGATSPQAGRIRNASPPRLQGARTLPGSASARRFARGNASPARRPARFPRRSRPFRRGKRSPSGSGYPLDRGRCSPSRSRRHSALPDSSGGRGRGSPN